MSDLEAQPPPPSAHSTDLNENSVQDLNVLSPERIAASRALQRLIHENDNSSSNSTRHRQIARDRFVWEFSRGEKLLYGYLYDLYMNAFSIESSTNPHKQRAAEGSTQRDNPRGESSSSVHPLLRSPRVVPSSSSSSSAAAAIVNAVGGNESRFGRVANEIGANHTAGRTTTTTTTTSTTTTTICSEGSRVHESHHPNGHSEKKWSIRSAAQFLLLDSGIVGFVCTFLFFLHLASLILLPSLAWDRSM